jgi:hypothetical protein
VAAVLVGLVRYKPGRRCKPEFRVDGVREPGGGRLPPEGELVTRWSEAIARAKVVLS